MFRCDTFYQFCFFGCWAYLTHWLTRILLTISIGKLESLLHFLTEILQQFVVRFNSLVFSSGILLPLLMVVVVLCVCVCVCVCAWYCHISDSKENVTFKVLTAMLLKSSEMWYCASGWVRLEISNDCSPFIFRVKKSFLIMWLLLSLEDDSTMILWNNGNYLPRTQCLTPEDLNLQIKCMCCTAAMDYWGIPFTSRFTVIIFLILFGTNL